MSLDVSLVKILKIRKECTANSKDAEQTAQMRRLVHFLGVALDPICSWKCDILLAPFHNNKFMHRKERLLPPFRNVKKKKPSKCKILSPFNYDSENHMKTR